jgi:hypothetical protein
MYNAIRKRKAIITSAVLFFEQYKRRRIIDMDVAMIAIIKYTQSIFLFICNFDSAIYASNKIFIIKSHLSLKTILRNTISSHYTPFFKQMQSIFSK